jgi:hypothetical protein
MTCTSKANTLVSFVLVVDLDDFRSLTSFRRFVCEDIDSGAAQSTLEDVHAEYAERNPTEMISLRGIGEHPFFNGFDFDWLSKL